MEKRYISFVPDNKSGLNWVVFKGHPIAGIPVAYCRDKGDAEALCGSTLREYQEQ